MGLDEEIAEKRIEPARWFYALLGGIIIGLLYTSSQFIGIIKAAAILIICYYYFPMIVSEKRQAALLSIAMSIVSTLFFSNLNPILTGLLLSETVLPIVLFEVFREKDNLKPYAWLILSIPFLLLSSTLFSGDILSLVNLPNQAELNEDLSRFYKQLSIPDSQITLLLSTVKSIYSWVNLLSPAIYFLSVFLPAVLAIYLRLKKEEVISFISFKLPDLLLLPFLIAIITGIWGPFRLGYNLALVFAVLWLLQGIAVIANFIKKKGLSRSFTWIIVAFIIIEPFLALFVFVLGLFDQLMDFRTEKVKEDKDDGDLM